MCMFVSGPGVSRRWKSLALCMPICVCVCAYSVCVWLEDRSVHSLLQHPLPACTAVRNLPFSLLKAGETMAGGMRAGGETSRK